MTLARPLGRLAIVGLLLLVPVLSYGESSEANRAADKSSLLRAYYQHWALPKTRAFVATSEALHSTLDDRCGDDARAAWREMHLSWAELAAIVVGPILLRRSLPTIDFQPPRERLIRRGLQAQSSQDTPLALHQLKKIGTPGKGIPVLEWLLFAAGPDVNMCKYARALAAELVAEARTLLDGWHDWMAGVEGDTELTNTLFSEFINQYVGAIERLRWQKMEKPLRAERDYPRASSGATRDDWLAHWRAVAFGGSGEGEAYGLLVAHLRWLGREALADELRGRIAVIDGLMANMQPGEDEEAILAATRKLAELKYLVETRVADALQVRIGFSDADGD